MPVCTKTLVRAGGDDIVYTVVLKNMSMKDNIAELACASLDSIALKVLQGRDIGRFLKEAVRKPDMCVPADGLPAGDNAMCVRGMRSTTDVEGKQQSVVCGRAVCVIDKKEMDTGMPAMHAALIVNDAPVEVTCIVSSKQNMQRNAVHFIIGDEQVGINVAALNTGRRCLPHVQWQPCQSHYLRRKVTSTSHMYSFANFGLQLTTPTHTKTPFFDVLLSRCETMTCASVFT